MNASDANQTPWWGTFEVEEGRAGEWQIGPLTLWLHRTREEWHVLHRSTGDSLAAHSEVVLPLPVEEWTEVEKSDDVTADRYSFRRTEPTVSLQPALADRPVVVRPEAPLSVPSGEQVTLYVSTPLWVYVLTAGQKLQEIPTIRPSDTWFGASTREGELCYASRTKGRSNLDDLPLRLHRAVTPLRVQNQAADTLRLERVQIPTLYLALYRSDGGFLWTQALTLARGKSGEGAVVHVEDGPPRVVPDAERIQEPRQELKKNLVVSTFRAIETLFGYG